MTQVIASDRDEIATLIFVNGSFGGLHIVRGAGFYFDKAQYFFVPSNEIDFSAAIWRAKISGDHDVALAAQVEVGVFFAAAAGALVLW